MLEKICIHEFTSVNLCFLEDDAHIAQTLGNNSPVLISTWALGSEFFSFPQAPPATKGGEMTFPSKGEIPCCGPIIVQVNIHPNSILIH